MGRGLGKVNQGWRAQANPDSSKPGNDLAHYQKRNEEPQQGSKQGSNTACSCLITLLCQGKGYLAQRVKAGDSPVRRLVN